MALLDLGEAVKFECLFTVVIVVVVVVFFKKKNIYIYKWVKNITKIYKGDEWVNVN